ncbi:gibberellin-regulated protein 5-like [Phragmites australis]|uniref:gibberellin-regulated protein 5-like n=1 Tax=Phragmites australis TaxID=29695 RepID=UPI002D7994E8|nr:gibberellin-regulated protein 5-like [Phragmites australis]
MAKPLALLLCILFLLALVSGEIAVDEELKNGAHKGQNDKGSNDGKGNLKPSQCAGECSRRCSRTHHKKPCLFFCNKCCAKCLCVPPGYYGNKETCPCYNNWKTKKGGPKCP